MQVIAQTLLGNQLAHLGQQRLGVAAQVLEIGHARFGQAKLSRNNAAALTTMDGPAGVSSNQDSVNPRHTATMPSTLAPSAICSGVRA